MDKFVRRGSVDIPNLGNKESPDITTEPLKRCEKTSRSPVRKRREESDMEKIQKTLMKLNNNMSDMKKELRDEVRNGNDELKKQMDENNKKITDMIEETRKEVALLKEKEKQWEKDREFILQEINEKQNIIKEEMEKRKILETRMNKMENEKEINEKEKRKNNIIISGVEFKEKEIITETRNFIKKELGVEVNIKEAFYIRKNANKIILAKIETWGEKLSIMRNKNKLRSMNTKIFIDNDLTPLERDIKRKIKGIAEEEKKKGSTVKIGYQKIQINEDWYTWENETSNIKKSDVNKAAKNGKKD